LYFARLETQPTFILANLATLLNNRSMKLIKPLICTLFISFSAVLPAAEDSAADNSAPATSETKSTETTPADRTPPDLSLQQQEDLARALAQNPETEVIWLTLKDEKQLALLQHAATATPTGTVIIFSDRSTSADWPAIVHPLRTQLTGFGWNTLSITLPQRPPTLIPKRTLPTLKDKKDIQKPADTENAPTTEQTAATPPATDQRPDSTSAAQTMTEYQTTISELGQQATNQLANVSGDIKIILGVGEGATWAMHYFMQDETQADRFLVLLDPRPVMDEDAPDLLQMISAIKAPVLDLWFNNTSVKQQRADLRKRAASRSGNEDYRQFRLNQRRNDSRVKPLWLTYQLRGILKTYVVNAQKPPPPAPQPKELAPGQ